MSIALKPLREQTIVITGASSGIGLTTARAAARAGAHVLLAARDKEALRGVCEELRAAGGVADHIQADVGEEGDVEAIAQQAIEVFGGFDTWVNDAGVGIVSTIEETSTEDHKRIFQTNYWGVVFGSLAAARHYRETGKPGAIINLGSAVSDMPLMFNVAYAASKHAIKGFTDGLRVELMHERLPISVTLIRPSSINTRFFDHAKTNMGGMGKAPGTIYEPEVVAKAILHAAQHPKRDIAVGKMATLGGQVAALAPGLIDARQANMADNELVDYGHMPEAENLYRPPAEGYAHSRFRSGRGFSLSTAAQTHPRLSAGAFIIAAVAATAFLLSSTARAR